MGGPLTYITRDRRKVVGIYTQCVWTLLLASIAYGWVYNEQRFENVLGEIQKSVSLWRWERTTVSFILVRFSLSFDTLQSDLKQKKKKKSKILYSDYIDSDSKRKKKFKKIPSSDFFFVKEKKKKLCHDDGWSVGWHDSVRCNWIIWAAEANFPFKNAPRGARTKIQIRKRWALPSFEQRKRGKCDSIHTLQRGFGQFFNDAW